MDISGIVEDLKQELSRIQNAITALEGRNYNAARRGRPPRSSGRRHMSTAAKARIGAAKKAWWAKQNSKAPGKKAIAKRKPMSPAVRKKLSALMKARWANKKKAA